MQGIYTTCLGFSVGLSLKKARPGVLNFVAFRMILGHCYTCRYHCFTPAKKPRHVLSAKEKALRPDHVRPARPPTRPVPNGRLGRSGLGPKFNTIAAWGQHLRERTFSIYHPLPSMFNPTLIMSMMSFLPSVACRHGDSINQAVATT